MKKTESKKRERVEGARGGIINTLSRMLGSWGDKSDVKDQVDDEYLEHIMQQFPGFSSEKKKKIADEYFDVAFNNNKLQFFKKFLECFEEQKKKDYIKQYLIAAIEKNDRGFILFLRNNYLEYAQKALDDSKYKSRYKNLDAILRPNPEAVPKTAQVLEGARGGEAHPIAPVAPQESVKQPAATSSAIDKSYNYFGLKPGEKYTRRQIDQACKRREHDIYENEYRFGDNKPLHELEKHREIMLNSINPILSCPQSQSDAPEEVKVAYKKLKISFFASEGEVERVYKVLTKSPRFPQDGLKESREIVLEHIKKNPPKYAVWGVEKIKSADCDEIKKMIEDGKRVDELNKMLKRFIPIFENKEKTRDFLEQNRDQFHQYFVNVRFILDKIYGVAGFVSRFSNTKTNHRWILREGFDREAVGRYKLCDSGYELKEQLKVAANILGQMLAETRFNHGIMARGDLFVFNEIDMITSSAVDVVDPERCCIENLIFLTKKSYMINIF